MVHCVMLHIVGGEELDVTDVTLPAQCLESSAQNSPTIPLIHLGKESYTKLGAGRQTLPEGHIPGGQHYLGVHGVRDGLNQVAVSAPVHFESMSY